MAATTSSRFWKAERIALAVVFVSLAWTTAPRLVALARETLRLSPMMLEQRRVDQFATLYTSTERLDTPGPLAVILTNRDDADLGVYVSYFRYPHPTRLYFGEAAYRRDAHAPKTVAVIDRRVAWEVRRIR